MGFFNIQNYVLNSTFGNFFQKYDVDNTGYLDVRQLGNFMNGVFQTLHIPVSVGQTQANILMKIMDRNGDGRVSRDQVFGLLKRILQVGSVGSVLAGFGFNTGGNSNSGNGNFGQGYNQGGFNQGGYNQGYNPSGYNQGYNQGGYNQGYNQGGFYQNQGGF